ncbi:MAG: class I SAM-dependent methyltransferase [Actinomycetota bacterium]
MNEYTPRWFHVFSETIPEEWTAREVAAVAERLPLARFPRILDLCCGAGRHATPLSNAGYAIVGADRALHALRVAASRAPRARFVCLDQRDVGCISQTFDGVLLLWQSFGYFSRAGNDSVLQNIARVLRPGGRLLIDVVHPDFYRARIGEQHDARAGVKSLSTTFDGDRMFSRIVYEDASEEGFDFETFHPDGLTDRAAAAGFDVVEACWWWERGRAPTPEEPRYQLVLETRT